MREMEPIRDPAMLNAIKARLHAQNLRDIAWFTVGINTLLRIGDMLRLKVEDVRLSRSRWREPMMIREQKTGKVKDVPLSPAIRKALQEYLATRPDAQGGDPLFQSRKGGLPLGR